MTIASHKLTIAEYLAYDDGTDTRYELVNGELVEMPPESWSNSLIAKCLFVEFLKLLGIERLCYKDTEIMVGGARATSRLPDLIVLSEELVTLLQGSNRGTITLDMPPPEVVVEVVSPGTENENRDYRYKRSEYAARGIREYWVIDPARSKVTVLTLESGLYEAKEFVGDVAIESRISGLQLTASQVLNP